MFYFLLLSILVNLFLLLILWRARLVLSFWIRQQGHERCWYYPDIFKRLCGLFLVNTKFTKGLPSRKEFENGCLRYQNEEYGEPVITVKE